MSAVRTHPSRALLDRVGRRRLDWLPVTAVFAVASLFLVHYTSKIGGPEVMTDEMLYQRLGLSIWQHLSLVPTVHDQFYPYYSLVYSLLIAPTFALGLQDAYRVEHVMNALIMASVVFPTYLLARSAGTSRLAALLAAAISAVVPWTWYSQSLLTEVPAYPAFMWGVLGIQRSIVSPGRRSDLLAVGGLLLAFFTRTQFVLLFAVLPAALVLHELLWTVRTASGRPRDRLRALGPRARVLAREHVVLLAAAGVALLFLIVLAATGPVGRVFGAYKGVATSGHVSKHLVAAFIRQTLAVVAVPLGFLPLIGWLAWLISTFLRPVSRRMHALAVTSTVAVAAVLLVASTFNLRTYGLVQERYAFYIAPLLIIGMLAFLERGRLRVLSLLAGSGVALWLMLSYSDHQIYTYLGAFNARWSDLQTWVSHTFDRPRLTTNQLFVALTAACAAGILALTVLLRRRSRLLTLAAGIAVLVFCAQFTAYSMNSFTSAQPPLHRGQNWVDRVVGEHAKVALIPQTVGDVNVSYGMWWNAEFWNRSVRRQWIFPGAPWQPTPFPSQHLNVDWETGAVTVKDPTPLVIVPLHDKRFGLAGRTLAVQDPLKLVRAALPLRAAWRITGVSADGWGPPKRPVSIRVFAPPGATAATSVDVHVQLLSDPSLEYRSYTISGGTRTVRGAVPTGAVRTASVPACVPPKGHVDLTAVVPQGGLLRNSPSVVGLAFTAVEPHYGGSCRPSSSA